VQENLVGKDVVRYRTDNFLHIYENIIPFFSKHALQSSKNQNYLDICKASEIIFLKKQISFNWKRCKWNKTNQIRYELETYLTIMLNIYAVIILRTPACNNIITFTSFLFLLSSPANFFFYIYHYILKKVRGGKKETF
jgi:hypothetical protein